MSRLIGILLLGFLIACSPFNQSQDYAATIDEVEFPNNQLLQVMGDKVFVYDLSIKDKTVEEIHLLVDYYESGEFIETMQEFSIPSEYDNKFTIAFTQQVYQDTYEKWTAAIVHEDGFGASTFENERPKEREEALGSVWGSVSLPLQIKKNDKSVVASISYSGNDIISNPAAIETDEQLQRLVDDDYVYVLSVQLK